MLRQVTDFITNYPEKADEQANFLTEGVQSNEMIYKNADNTVFLLNDLDDIFSVWKNNIDYINGGYGSAPKFPMPVSLHFLLQYHYLTQNPDALKAVTVTLDKMAQGGIYDQVGGGFSRYSTDEFWKVPHFEKMLYDNAQLVSLYAAAYQKTKDPEYKRIVTETLDFVKRELTSPEGGFYSSIDADSEDQEGKFYVWTFNEITKILGNHASMILEYYHVTERGNWENSQNILYKTRDYKKIANKYKLSETELNDQVARANKTLLQERSKRIRPATDDKILTSWNAMMMKGYIDAYRIFDQPEYLEAALKNANLFLTIFSSDDAGLYRSYKDGKAVTHAFLDDYAFTIQAFISLYQATFDEKWLVQSQKLTTYVIDHFYDSSSGMFYYTSDTDPSLIARKMEISDNVIPSSNSEMAKNLFILGRYFYNEEYINLARKMMNNVKSHALNGEFYYANWDILMSWFALEPYFVAIVGKEFEMKRKEFDTHYLPNVFLYGGENEGSLSMLEGKLKENQTTMYVCRNNMCKIPVNVVVDAINQLL